MRRRPDGVERVAGVDDEVDLTLQDLVDCSPVRLLSVDLPLVSVGLRAELRVPRVPQVRIRDVSDPDYVSDPFCYGAYAILAAYLANSRVEDQNGPRQFEIVVRLERRRDLRYLSHEEGFQVGVRDVAGRHEQELVRSLEQ